MFQCLDTSHHQGEIQKLENRARSLFSQIEQLECKEENSTTRPRPEFGQDTKTKRDLNKNRKTLVKTNNILELLLKQERTIARDLTSLMNGEEGLANRTRIIFDTMQKQTMELSDLSRF